MLTDQVVVITGASSGVGRATALAFARSGARLVLASRSRPALDDVAAQCRDAGAEARVVVADVLRPETVAEVADTAVTAFGGIDVWVNTAAVMAYGRFEDVPADVFDRVVEVDLLGGATVARAALDRFRRQGHGILIFGGSLLGTVVTPYTSSYVTSKWGLRALIRALRLETRDAPDIHVCLVSPGAVNTPIYRNAANYAGVAGKPPPPIDQPETVAAAIVRCARKPRATVNVGVANKIINLGFVVVPGLYDVLVGPLMRVGGLSREVMPAHRGNVFEPTPPDAEGLHGEWRPAWWRPRQAAGTAAVLAAALVAGRWAARLRR
ncbi:SDR family NAD(P)-dependent oxidoreductase [Actinoplanes philippinensis]|uniref:SDR family NAD(P)-dependent oxidoreductase n=1 Tax=Actinoplanes philippinensis TaxID=35752 RepID=UPI00340BD2D8